MKIIEAARYGELAFVQVMERGVLVTLRKEGDVSSITTSGQGNVRMAKHVVKSLGKILEEI